MDIFIIIIIKHVYNYIYKANFQITNSWLTMFTIWGNIQKYFYRSSRTIWVYYSIFSSNLFYFAFCSEAKNRNTFLKLHFPGTAHLRDNVSHATNLKSNYLKTSLVRYFTYSSLADREVSYNSLYKSLHSFQLLGCVQFLTIWKQHFCTLMMEENLELNTPEWQKRAEDFLSMKEWTVAVSSPSPLIILANYQQQKPC